MERKKKIRCFAVGAAAILLAAGGGIAYQVMGDRAGTEEASVPENIEAQQETGDGFSEEGTTQTGVLSQLPEFSVGAVTMTVEEVYKEAGDTVSAGEALMKLTEESMEDARDYYEKAVAEAARVLASAEAELASGDLEAKNGLQETKLDAENAADSYQAAVDEIDVKVAEKKEAYDTAVETIQEYQSEIDNGTYYTKNGLSEKKDAVTQAETNVGTAQSNLSETKNTADSAALAVGSRMTELQEKISENADYETLKNLTEKLISEYETQQNAAATLTEAQKAADTAQSKLEQAQQTFDNAVEAYHKDTEEANQKITELTEQLEGLLSEYESARRNAEAEKLELKNQYDTAVLEGNYADSTYQATVNSLEAAVETAKENLETLQEEQEALQALEDGVIKAGRDGTIAYIAYEAGDTLVSGAALAAYSDTSTVTVSVEVSEEQISRVEVGQEVSVRISGSRDNVTGTVSAVASSATAGGSISNVTYAVTVSIDNADGRLGAGTSAVVTFTSKEKDDTGTGVMATETIETETETTKAETMEAETTEAEAMETEATEAEAMETEMMETETIEAETIGTGTTETKTTGTETVETETPEATEKES